MNIKFYINGFRWSASKAPEIIGNLIFYDDNNNQYCWLEDNPIVFSFYNIEHYEKWKKEWKNIIVWQKEKGNKNNEI